MKHEKSEISDKEIKFFMSLRSSPGWKTSKEVANAAKCSPRTGRMYALKFVRLGIADLAEVFPEHRYRIAERASRRNASYIQRLEQAIEVFGFAQVPAKVG